MGEELFEKCMTDIVNGNKQGLRMIYEAYSGYVYTVVYGILGNKENAEDVTSGFFIRLWERAGQYRPGKGHKGYLAAACLCIAVAIPVLYGGLTGDRAFEATTSAPMEKAAFAEEAAPAEESGAPGLADGTVVIGVEIIILEKSQMKYHTVYRASVLDGNGVFSVGEELEIWMEEEQEEIWTEGETYRVDLIYDSRWEIPFRPFENGG